MIAFSQLLEAGVAGLIDAVSALEAELKATKEDIAGLNERIRYLENTQKHHHSVLEDLTLAGLPTEEGFAERVIEAIKDDSTLEDMVDSMLDMKLDDAIESALSGREVDVNISGTITL